MLHKRLLFSLSRSPFPVGDGFLGSVTSLAAARRLLITGIARYATNFHAVISMPPPALHPMAKMPRLYRFGIDGDVDSFPNLSLDDRGYINWVFALRAEISDQPQRLLSSVSKGVKSPTHFVFLKWSAQA
jgi:hypothetical protein